MPHATKTELVSDARSNVVVHATQSATGPTGVADRVNQMVERVKMQANLLWYPFTNLNATAGKRFSVVLGYTPAGQIYLTLFGTFIVRLESD